METLKFRRQFLLSPKACAELESWNHDKLGDHHLYVHPDCLNHKVQMNGKTAILLGHILDPHSINNDETSILKNVLNKSKPKEIGEVLYSLTGRFVLIIQEGTNFIFFNDACGLKSFFYTSIKDEFYAASQPLLLKLVTENLIVKGPRYYSYHNSEYVKSSKEHWFPCGTSLYPGVFHLVANHYLKSEDLKQVRYWPVEPLEYKNYEESKNKFANLLRLTMENASRKYDLGLGITGGYDSRILLSACKNAIDRMFFYTLQYRNLTEHNNDMRIPINLSKTLGINHSIMDCRIKIDETFKRIYLENSDMSHLNDWGFISYGIFKNFPKNAMSVKGSCSETGRCFFYKNGKHPKIKSSLDIIAINPKWKHIPFITKRIDEWYNEVKSPEVNKNYNILDLYHWEVSTGSWQTQSQLEWDIAHDTFTPFNNREILETMLQIEPKYRSRPNNYILYRETMELLWPEVLSEPINPLTSKLRLKHKLKSFLASSGFEKYNR